VLETAFTEAAARGSSLRVLHAWRLATEYDDILADDPRWVAEVEADINTATEDFRAKFADVTVHVDVRHELTADALVEAACGSDLLVIGRHSGLPLLPTRVGSLARSVAAHAPCPVMIVPV
jgi:nucleotide-binding universal stress UspA family protein